MLIKDVIKIPRGRKPTVSVVSQVKELIENIIIPRFDAIDKAAIARYESWERTTSTRFETTQANFAYVIPRIDRIGDELRGIYATLGQYGARLDALEKRLP